MEKAAEEETSLMIDLGQRGLKVTQKGGFLLQLQKAFLRARPTTAVDELAVFALIRNLFFCPRKSRRPKESFRTSMAYSVKLPAFSHPPKKKDKRRQQQMRLLLLHVKMGR